MFLLPATTSLNYPQSTWYTLPTVSKHELTADGLLMVEPSVIYREYDLNLNEVYLPHSTDKVVYIRPAFGETRRNPKRFVAIVLMDGNEKRSKSVAIHAGQKLMVM